MRCYRCGAPFGGEQVGVRDVCERCAAYLHCCRNCTFYEPGLANDCREPNAEHVADKELGNFCDHFRPALAAGAPAGKPTGSARADLEALFRKKRPRS
jgi:hypothetical protein